MNFPNRSTRSINRPGRNSSSAAGIVDEIRLAQGDGNDTTAGDCHLQAAGDGFNFRQFWH